MAEGSRIPHEIHLAKHEGYDINRPKEFVQKYGSFVLTMMQMVKYGFTAAGIIVPPLAHFGVVEGIDAVRKGLDLARTSIGSLIDQTIAFIQNQKNDDSGGIDLPTETINLDRLEVLEGTELRQLESYLNAGDKDHTLGNLYRTVTTEGHVKWVCLDHYRENYRESTTQRLKDAVTENGGVYNEEEGSINICIQSKSRAKRFYKIMVKARGIQVLDITFGWDATLGDLRAFESAVLKANIIELTINGTHFNGPAMDFINRRRRFVPILNLICNGLIQSLRLNNTRHFDQHINGSFAAMAPRLRVLSLGPGFSLKNPVTASNFTKILTHCSSLNELRQYSEHNAPLFEATLDNIINLPNLQSMSFGSEAYSLHTAISKSMAHEVVMSILQLGDLSSDGEMILQKGRLTMLSLEQTPRTADESRLADLICQNPELRFLDIPCHGERSNEILSLISSTRDKILQGGSTTALSDIQLAKDTWFSFKTKSVLTSVAGHVVNEGDPISFTLDASIKMAGDDAIDENDISSVFRQFGWSIRTLKANSTFSDELAKLLDEATRLKGSSLRWLKLDPWSLTSPGLDCMDRIIERSLDLECLLLCNFGFTVTKRVG
ncbi:hypothetical protein BGZ58_000890 [Dissophora ornata]|nr:hypothetical protein BGZ58_000890 [Dissophora ornata]